MLPNSLKLAWLVSIFSLAFVPLTNPAQAASPETKDVFDIIGVTPQQVASSMAQAHALPNHVKPRPRPMLAASAWVGMPMTEDHRRQFIEALRNGHKGFGYESIERWDAVLDLLEEDGRVEEALAFLPDEELLDTAEAANPRGTLTTAHRHALVRRVGFLMKAGKKEEAAELVGKLCEMENRIYPWTAISAVDLAMGRSKQAIDIQEFLLRETAIDANSFALLARQQIQLARSMGGMDGMIADDVPPALRAVRLDILGRPEEAAAVWRAALPSLSSTDMLRLRHLQDFMKSPGFGEKVATLLNDPVVATADKADLICSFEGREKRLELFFGMNEAHDKVIRELEVASLILSSGMKNDRPELSVFLARCDRLLEIYPKEPKFHLLRAACVDSNDPSHRASLVVVAQGGPADSQLACDAIKQLMPICTAAEFDRIITQAPSYPELSAAERLRRFRAAELDQRVVETLDGVDFSKPEGDSISSDVGSHLSHRSQTHEIPAKVVERVLPILTPLCVGSPVKTAAGVQSSINSWFNMLSRVKVPDETLIRAARDIAAIVADRKISIQKGMFQSIPPDVRQAAGIAVTPVKPRDLDAEFPPWSIAIEMFGHPQVAHLRRSFPEYDFGRAQINGTAAGDKGVAVSLLAVSPWMYQAQVAAIAANLSRRDDKAVRIAAMVRGLFPADARRAGAYDALVATSLLPCADAGVKDLAAKHAARIAASPVLDNPELVVFLHVMGFGKQDDSPPDAARPPDIDALLPHEKDGIGRALQMCVRPSRSRTSQWPEVQELLGQLYPPRAHPVPIPPPPPVAEVSDYDRLKSLQSAGSGRSVEALTLARKVLDQFVNERKRHPGYDVNLSVNLLVDAGEFEAYLGQTRERFAREAWPEADIQRALMRLHAYRIIHPVETAFPYAKRLFELVPTDIEAAEIVFEIAMKKKDADTVGRCLVAIAAQSGFRFRAMLSGGHAGGPLSLFKGEKAADLIRALVATPMEGTVPDHWKNSREYYERSMLELLYFALNEAPEQFDALLDWSQLLNSNDKVLTLRLAEAMKKAGMPDKAVSMLAERYFFMASKQSADALRFEERQRHKGPVERRGIPIRDLARAGLLDPLAALAEATEPNDGNRRELALVRLAARPTMEAWKTIVLPALPATPISERDALRDACLHAAAQVDDSEELRVLIAVEKIRSGKSRPWLSPDVEEPMKLAVSLDAADRDDLFPVLWKRAAEILAAEHPDPNRDSFIQDVLLPMMLLASDPDWKAYLKELRKTKSAIDSIAFSLSMPLPPEVKIDRLRDVAGLIFEMAKPGKPPGQFVQQMIAKLGESGDFDTDVAAFRPLFFNIDMTRDYAARADKSLASIQRLIDLVSGDSSAILPVLDVQADERGGCQFRWSLTGDGNTDTPSPRDRRFKQFDGRFDVVLLAGPEPRRLSRVAEQQSVPGDGTGRCEIPPGSRFAALMVTERDGSVVHWTDPVTVRKSESWQDLPLPENGDNARGPFDDTPARDYQLDDGAELLLADVPWDEGPVPSFSIWAMGEIQYRGASTVFIRYVDDAVQKVGKSDSEYGNLTVPVTSSPVRQWCKLELPDVRLRTPPTTTRIQLVYRGPDASRGDGGPPGRVSVRLAELKVQVPVTPLPKGVEKLGRVPSSICGVAFDAEGKRLALASRHRGVGVFDMDAKTFGGWIPLAEKIPANGIGSIELKIVGDRIFHIDVSAKVRVIDLKKRSSVMLNPDPDSPSRFSGRSKMSISQDGSFVALSYVISGYEVFHIDEDGKLASRTFTSGSIWNFAFDEKKNVLLAGESNRIWTLPLADWKTAEPQLSAGEVSPPKEKITECEYGAGANLDGRRISVDRSDSSEWKLISSGATWAMLSVPTGILFQAGIERAWLITPGGSIYGIAFGEVGR